MSEWISVEERLPDEQVKVICYFSEKSKVETSWHVISLGFMFEGIFGKVSHWMPLPEPPKEAEK